MLEKRINWFLVSLSYLCLFFYGLIDNVRGPVFPDLLRDFSLSDTKGALFFLVASFAALLNNVVFFKWMERLGAFRVTQVYTGFQFLGLLIMGVAPTYEWVLVGAAVMGSGFGGLGIAVNLLVAQATPSRWRRQTLSGLHCMYGVSSLLAPLLVSGLYLAGLNWHWVLACTGLGSLIVFAFSFLSKPNEASHSPVPKVASGSDHRSKKIAIYYSLMNTCYVIAELALSTRLVLYARRDIGYSIESANLLLSGFFVGLFLGRLFFAVARVPLSNSQVLMGSAWSSLVFFSLGLLHAPEWLALTGLSLSAFYPCVIALLNDELGESRAAYVTSWSITVQSLGLMLMHFVLGQVSDLFGLSFALWLGPLCLVLVIVFLCFRSRLTEKYLHSY